MVSDLSARSKNCSKMKSPKTNGRSRRNKLSFSKDQPAKSPKKEPLEFDSSNKKVKSGSWKRSSHAWNVPSISNLKTNLNESTFPSLPTKPKPNVLYSEVLFNGEKLKTPVKVKNLTPRNAVKLNSKNRKRLISMERTSTPIKGKEICSSKISFLDSAYPRSINYVPQSSNDLEKCIHKLIKRLNIAIPAWNFDDYGIFSDIPQFECCFDDYNYLTCENMALLGIRLATDGKFKCY